MYFGINSEPPRQPLSPPPFPARGRRTGTKSETRALAKKRTGCLFVSLQKSVIPREVSAAPLRQRADGSRAVIVRQQAARCAKLTRVYADAN